MRRIKLVLAYDGTNYSGWQFQKNAVTIEEVLNKALSQLMGEEISVIGASRTDAGVHALENVAVFDTDNRMAADKICLALNQWLPEDIRALNSEEVALDWHPRKQNCTKTYEYRILNRKINMPTQRLYSYFCYFPLDVEKMREGAAYLIGEHDFKSFCAPRGQAEETVRTIYSLELDKQGDMITLRISGSGFLYNMVRIIAGTLIKVGIGVYPPEHVEEILDARDRRAAGPTAPAKGLTLVRMEYEKQLREKITGENKDWSYELIQRDIAAKGRAYLVIRRCADRDFDRLLLRVTHQAMRNGARQVYVCDQRQTSGGEAGTARIVEGKAYGYYVFHHAYDWITVGKTARASAEDAYTVSLCPAAGTETAVCRELASRIFKAAPDFAAEWETESGLRDGGELYFLRENGVPVGMMRLSLCGDSMRVDLLGIIEEYRRKGLAMAALAQAERLAKTRGLARLQAGVSTGNEPALCLYEKYGFRRETVVSRWYSWLSE